MWMFSIMVNPLNSLFTPQMCNLSCQEKAMRSTFLMEESAFAFLVAFAHISGKDWRVFLKDNVFCIMRFWGW